jgi:hypothetical protein
VVLGPSDQADLDFNGRFKSLISRFACLGCLTLWLVQGFSSFLFSENALASQRKARDLFQLYRAGQYSDANAGFQRVSDWRRFIADLRGQSGSWPPAVAAAFALEASAEVLRPSRSISWSDAMELLEIGCRIVTQSQISGSFALQWNLAATAMYEGFGTELPAGVAGGTMLRQHRADHAIERFPADVRFRLAKLREHERALYWYLFVNRVAVEGPVRRENSAVIVASGARQMEELGEAFEKLRTEPAVRVEATIRAVFWRMMAGRADQAVRLLDEFEGSAQVADPWYRYLAYLFRGRLLAERDDHTGAVGSYQKALVAWTGDSARSALAASLFLADRRDEAAKVVHELLKSPSERSDPWAWYPFGDHRFWEERRRQLRQSLQ